MCQRSCLMYWLPRDGEGERRLGMRADCSLGTHWLPWLQIWPGLACFGVVWFAAMVPALKFQLLRQMINEHVAANFLAFCLAGQSIHYEDTPQATHLVCVGVCIEACHSLTCAKSAVWGTNLLNFDQICKACWDSTWKELRKQRDWKLKECLLLFAGKVAVTLQL